MSELVKYPVYQSYYVSNSKPITEKMLSDLNYGGRYGGYGKQKETNTFAYCVMFPGYEKLVKRIIDARNDYADNLTVEALNLTKKDQERKKYLENSYGAMGELYHSKSSIYRNAIFVFPPSEQITEDEIFDVNMKLIVAESKNAYSTNYRNKDEQRLEFLLDAFGCKNKTLIRYIDSHQRKPEYDLRELQRFVTINNFCIDATNNNVSRETALGEYFKNNEESLTKETVSGSLTQSSEDLEDFALNYFNSNSILGFLDRSLKKNQALIDSLTFDELETIVKMKTPLRSASYTRDLKNVIQDAKSSDNVYSEDELTQKLFDFLTDRFKETYNDDAMLVDKLEQNLSYVSEFIKYGKTNNLLSKTIIVKFIEENSEKLSLMNIIMLINGTLLNQVFRSADGDKILELLKTALTHYDDPIPFIKFITRLFFNHNGHIASYSEWLNYIKDSQKDDDFSLPMNIIISLMVSRDKTRSLTNYETDVINNYRKIFLKYATEEETLNN